MIRLVLSQSRMDAVDWYQTAAPFDPHVVVRTASLGYLFARTDSSSIPTNLFLAYRPEEIPQVDQLCSQHRYVDRLDRPEHRAYR